MRWRILRDIFNMLPNNTRHIIDVVAKMNNTSKQRVCGYLSWLKRSKQIEITTIIPNKFSVAR